ncbi:cell wall protein IFF6-like, partial [Anneissia japonica]|uniref:cell wall protein IFF6-like n=1 Tax=Anneissia japonica TaxID=1529436 RepID=UPI001425778B
MMRLLEVPIFVVFICLVGNSISDTKPTASSTTTNGNYTETNTTERMDSTTERMDTGFALNTATDVTDSTATYTRETEVKKTGVATATTTENWVRVGETEETTTIKGNKMTGEDGRNGATTATMKNGVTGGGGSTEGQDATATMGNAGTENRGATENGVTVGGGGEGQGGNGNGDGN